VNWRHEKIQNPFDRWSQAMLLQLDGQGPRYTQIRRALCGLIQSGVLEPGVRVPPSRELANDLGCSRNLVLLAYEQLAIEGYLTTRRGGGTFVAADLPAASPTALAEPPSAAPIRLSSHGRRIAEVTGTAVGAVTRRPRTLVVDFVYGLCEPDARIVAAIRTVMKRILRERPFEYANVAGDEGLRRQLALRLRSTRGIARPAEHLLVTSGAQQALDICVRLLVNPGDRVVVEDPAYRGVDSALVAAGAEILRVPVDRHGLLVSELPEGGPPVRLVYVTPSHQFPTGAVMPASRRYALLAWARRTGALILEDDYDSEFRHDGRPIESLAALDRGVIYCGTFAKSLFPSLRLGYLSLPASLVEAAVGCKWLSDLGSPAILQRLVGELMARGAYDRHIRRMQRRYRMRRDVLVNALRRRFESDVEIRGEEAGLHLVAELRDLPADRVGELTEACRQRGIGVYTPRNALVVYANSAAVPRDCARLLLGYGLTDVGQIEDGVKVLADVYRRLKPSSKRVRRRRT
jgi:GntR family transcriptional regulator/MocR family aminotransferase